MKRLGKTVVQHKDANVKAVLSWRYANQTFEKEPWLLLELAFAAEGQARQPEPRGRLAPDARRASASRCRARSGSPRGSGTSAGSCRRPSVARDPVAGYFPQPEARAAAPVLRDPGRADRPGRDRGRAHDAHPGDLFFEAPTGVWKPGRYTLVLKNKEMDVELPFTLPADDPKKDAKEEDGKTVTW